MNAEVQFMYNGDFYSAGERVITTDNRSFKYGDGFFETMKMMNGNIVFETLHFKRLFSSLQALYFDQPDHLTKEFFIQKIKKLTAKNNHQTLSRIRLTLFRGDGNLYDDDNTPNYIIQSWPLPSFPYYNEEGFTIDFYRVAQKICDGFSGIKSNNYLPYAMAALWCKKQNLNDAFICNSHRRIAEATTSNVFVVKDGLIKTPALPEGCIDGVTRKYLLHCFEKESIACEQASLSEDDIYDADEIFLTNSGFYIQWIQQCGTKFYINQVSKKLYQQFITPLLKANEK